MLLAPPKRKEHDTPTHIVKPGDTVSAIALRYWIKSWQELYNDPSNASFRAKRPNPNLIFPGDQIEIVTNCPPYQGLALENNP